MSEKKTAPNADALPISGYLDDPKYGRIPVLDVHWSEEIPAAAPPNLRSRRRTSIDIYPTRDELDKLQSTAK